MADYFDDPKFALGVLSTKLDAAMQKKPDQAFDLKGLCEIMKTEFGETDRALIDQALDDLWSHGRAVEFRPGFYCLPENRKRVEAAEKQRAYQATLPGNMKKTRAEYEAMPPAAQSEFFKSGGVLV
jgi:hypothetical protein